LKVFSETFERKVDLALKNSIATLIASKLRDFGMFPQSFFPSQLETNEEVSKINSKAWLSISVLHSSRAFPSISLKAFLMNIPSKKARQESFTLSLPLGILSYMLRSQEEVIRKLWKSVRISRKKRNRKWDQKTTSRTSQVVLPLTKLPHEQNRSYRFLLSLPFPHFITGGGDIKVCLTSNSIKLYP
jgi:hypothetical protein